ncbi:MAG TPA: hypothetical protein VJ998_01655, partial [Pseudomonadales bacterium]|nr:hypothetical protein [Pseudomonadales bacterium]
DLASGSYYSGRKPEDGAIDWSLPAADIHNLVRAVAPPWPGAYFDTNGMRLHILGSHYRGEAALSTTPGLYWQSGALWADCADGKRFRILSFAIDGETANEVRFGQLFGQRLDTGA